jgi:hypothetical protein
VVCIQNRNYFVFSTPETTLEALADADMRRIWHDGWQTLLRDE